MVENSDAIIDLEGISILIAKDVDLNYYFIERILKKTKAIVFWAENGQEAVELCRKNKDIALVIMDIQMPILNGWEATRQIKEFRQDLPIIALTAYALSNEEEKSTEAGCNGFLTKPIKPKILISELKKFLP
jgi:CheY-like chemotaxis protein